MIDDPAQRVAIAIVAPICPLIPAVILLIIAVLQPWWVSSRDITYYPTNTSSFTVTQRSEISLWGHHGCKLNETWSDICGLPDAECVYPPAPPLGYIPPWTPPPLTEDDNWRVEVVTGPPGVRMTTTRQDRPFRCVTGNCQLPVVTTTIDRANLNQDPNSINQNSVSFGDGQARLGEEVVSSNEDSFRIPNTAAPPSPPTSPPTFEPEVGEVDPRIFATAEPTTSWRPQGPFAGLWASVGTESREDVSVGQLYERTDPSLGANTEIPRAPIPGAQLAVEKCPPYAERFWDPLSPPAGQFICQLRDTCGKVPPVLACLFITGGLLCVNIAALCGMGCASQGSFDVTAAYCSVGILPVALISHIVGLSLAAEVGLSPPAFQMSAVGAVCAIMSLLLVILALLLACGAVCSNCALSKMLERAEETERIAHEHAQANLEATEEWRLKKDKEAMAKKPAPLGWRSKKVVPEETLGLEDQAQGARGSTPPSEVATSAGGSSIGTPRGSLQAAVLAIGDAAPPSEALVSQVAPEQRLSVAVRSVYEVAPSPATESCMRSFINSPEGAVYAQRCAQPSSVPNTAREVSDWIPKVSRSNGMTYYVNAETGETRWTPPGSPHDAWSGDLLHDTGDTASQASHAPAPAVAEMWKKKRLKNGTVISVRAG